MNNPPVGLVTGASDPDAGKRTYAYDPHLDPQLVWAGKAEHTSFEVPTVSLHEHERVDPRSIIKAVRRNGKAVRQPSFSKRLKRTCQCAKLSSSTSTDGAGRTVWWQATACWL